MAVNIYGDQDRSPIDDAVPQLIVDHCFDLAEVAQPLSLGEPGFVWESESGCWGPLCTEQGKIEIVRANIPDVLPLCIDNEYLAEWYVDILSVGGYEPWDGYIDVWQKGLYKGTIKISWTWLDKGPCCAADYWRATFYVDQEICLESNQYPDVAPWMINYPDGQETIPGKCVNLYITTYWTGCVPGDQPSQDFTIIPTQSYWAFSTSFILTLKTHITTVHITTVRNQSIAILSRQ